MESGQMYIGSDRRNQPKEPISVPRRIRRLVFRGFGTRMTEGTRETGSFGPGSTNTPFGFRVCEVLRCGSKFSINYAFKRQKGEGKGREGTDED